VDLGAELAAGVVFEAGKLALCEGQFDGQGTGIVKLGFEGSYPVFFDTAGTAGASLLQQGWVVTDACLLAGRCCVEGMSCV
jgi:hypothetical protein